MLFAGFSLVVALCIPAGLALQSQTRVYTNLTSTSTPHSTISPQSTSKTCVTDCMDIRPPFHLNSQSEWVLDSPSTPDSITTTQVTRPPNAPSPTIDTISFKGQINTINSASDIFIGSQTLTPGGVITVSGTPYSLPAGGSYVIKGTSTVIFDAATRLSEVVTIGAQVYTMNTASDFVIGGQTLTPGGALTVSGTPISFPAGGSYVVEGTSTATFLAATQPPEVVTIGAQIYTINTASDFVIGGQTLTPGGAITVSGTPISLPADGSYFVEVPSTATLVAATQPPEAITIGAQIYTMNTASDFVIGSNTLTPGGIITISGTPVSLAATPTDIVVGTSTQRLGDLIMSGMGGYNGPAPTATFASTGAHRMAKSTVRMIAGVAAGVAASAAAFV